MIEPDEPPAFRVEASGDTFRIVNREGKTVLSLATLANAEQYAAMLNEAYGRGYKAGFRKAQRTRDPEMD
jgi:hypothetical protein